MSDRRAILESYLELANPVALIKTSARIRSEYLRAMMGSLLGVASPV
jgi:hypothetical protein